MFSHYTGKDDDERYIKQTPLSSSVTICYRDASATLTATSSVSGPISQRLHGPLEILYLVVS